MKYYLIAMAMALTLGTNLNAQTFTTEFSTTTAARPLTCSLTVVVASTARHRQAILGKSFLVPAVQLLFPSTRRTLLRVLRLPSPLLMPAGTHLKLYQLQ